MKKSEQPLTVVAALLGLSLAFWGKDMADYIQKGPPLVPVVTLPDIKSDSGAVAFLKSKAAGFAQLLTGEKNDTSTESIEWTKYCAQLWNLLKESSSGPHLPAEGAQRQLTNQDSQYLWQAFKGVLWSLLAWLSTLGAGCVFMFDIACVYWWYFRYIYRVEPTPNLRTYFLDFGVCAGMNTAAARWTNASVFLLASSAATSLLLCRFANLYYSDRASDTDQDILKRAGKRLGWAVGSLVVAYLVASRSAVNEAGEWKRPTMGTLFYSSVVTGLSLVGVWLTWRFRDQIALSVERHAIAELRFRPMELHWPDPLRSDVQAMHTIRNGAREGVSGFRRMFTEGQPKHDRLISRVHAEGDLLIQSGILAIPSWRGGSSSGNGQTVVEEGEIERKAWMVGMSHWLDDLLDGRAEDHVYRVCQERLRDGKLFALEEPAAFETFELIFREVVTKHTDPTFFDKLARAIRQQATVPDNRRFLFSSLNRVAVGAVIYSPRLRAEQRHDLLQEHNLALERNVKASASGPQGAPWLKNVTELLNQMERGEDELGDHLIGLTTKTVMELSMASEGPDVYFPLAVLYSLFYAPLLYFHDIDSEVDAGEMAVIETFDVNYECIVPWMHQIRHLIGEYPDERKESRLLQMSMAFHCFRNSMPEVVREDLSKIYCVTGNENGEQRDGAAILTRSRERAESSSLISEETKHDAG
jgi:hypothetical protein